MTEASSTPSRKCSLCDDTGAKDYAGFAMDGCDHDTAGLVERLRTSTTPNGRAMSSGEMASAMRQAAAIITRMDAPAGDFLARLRKVNAERWAAWSGSSDADPLFMSNEFAGEAGEVCNVVKKLVRETRGWKGSRSSVEDLGDEIADAVICLDSLARAYGLNLADVVTVKFDKTSIANGFPHRLGAA